jgi:hypothetical protein
MVEDISIPSPDIRQRDKFITQQHFHKLFVLSTPLRNECCSVSYSEPIAQTGGEPMLTSLDYSLS